ncbi:biotin synthase related domain containing protein [Aquipluma nitroreducens]|uniref:Biotin synthase related domain containing protein n=1 Tax=Aquipluma nitroreducens TaxID=2010828 RepID=A0A5K7S6V3_9BACT|nr:putative DNA modification/repair radical SAM protein [Aquipluma nitroreducens]BBE17266.1 biotin synthase related domain containing protein [Aquipluma nitroreducens]
MISESSLEKLKILAGAAKYDVSCASSGTKRGNTQGGIGNATAWGICHSFAEDGRCISLLKIMLSNYCIYDCAYCYNRKSNDIPRTSFTPDEIANLTIEFYRRNYIEGLFLSSGVLRNPDHTMEQMVSVVKKLRTEQRYNGYIHMKTIPGASQQLVTEAGRWADRLSVNIEIPTENNLKILAPDKDFKSVLEPMKMISTGILESKEERKNHRNAPLFSPSGQSTQLIIGATNDTDHTILKLSSALYTRRDLKRVYYSGYIPVNSYDNRLPALSAPPLRREHRLYQADWLMRFYGFRSDEIVNTENPNLDLDLDPKVNWALRNPHLFPVDINTADPMMLLRVPGIGTHSIQLILMARKHQRLNSAHLKKMGVVMKRAQFFITCNELRSQNVQDLKPEIVRQLLLDKKSLGSDASVQLKLFYPMTPALR